MAYTTQQAIETLNGYLSINENDKKYIDDTKKRGFVLELSSGERIVIFVYPLVHKQDNTKNYFDTRDSGAYERGVAWKYAQKEGLKYFCLGVNDQVDKYEDYIFSLECDEKEVEKISGTKDGNRNGPGNQIIIPNDYRPNKEFERIQNKLGIYIATIKKSGLKEYLEYYDNRPYLGKQNIDDDLQKENEYQRAANILTKHIEESGLELPSNDDAVEQCRADFMERYSPDKLAALSDEEVLQYIFYSSGDNSDALCYWIERNTQCREFFGSIAGGSAYKFGLFQKKDTGVWTSGSANNSKELSDEEALQVGKSIRDALVNGSKLISEANPQTIEDYEKMDDDLKELIGDQFYNMAWFHKYYAMTTGDILSCYHNDTWQFHVLYSLLIKPSTKFYARSGQIAMVREYANMSLDSMHHVIGDKFGMPKSFVRIGTSDDVMNYVDEWRRRSVVGIGWKDIGSLESYLYGDGIDKKAIADKLQEIYYGNDARTASRKAGELVRFYKTDEDTVFVAMSGERLIAFIDSVGNYFYDPSSDMSHMKPGKWHENFAPADVLPEKSEGKLTSCYQLTDENNLMYLYRKYYYPDDDMELEVNLESEDPEERNKRLFRYWMGLQVKPEGDSDAGNPYSEQSIDSYINSIEKTPLPMVAEHSVFYTTDIGQVNQAMDELKKEPEKNGSQRSAVKKYIQYLIDYEEDYMMLIYNTNIDVDYERNRIVFGAPGTGKSFGLKDDCDKLMADTVGTYERVTFHPDYSYSQFVGTYKPVMDSDGRSIRYDFVPGPFMRVYVDALKSGSTTATFTSD